MASIFSDPIASEEKQPELEGLIPNDNNAGGGLANAPVKPAVKNKLAYAPMQTFAFVEGDADGNPVLESDDAYDCCTLVLHDRKTGKACMGHISIFTDMKSIPALVKLFNSAPGDLVGHVIPGCNSKNETGKQNFNDTMDALTSCGVKSYWYRNSIYGGSSTVQFTPKDGTLYLGNAPEKDRKLRLEFSHNNKIAHRLLCCGYTTFIPMRQVRKGLLYEKMAPLECSEVRNNREAAYLLPNSEVRDADGKVWFSDVIPCNTQEEMAAYRVERKAFYAKHIVADQESKITELENSKFMPAKVDTLQFPLAKFKSRFEKWVEKTKGSKVRDSKVVGRGA